MAQACRNRAAGTLDVAQEPERIIPAQEAFQSPAALVEQHRAEVLAVEAQKVVSDQAGVSPGLP